MYDKKKPNVIKTFLHYQMRAFLHVEMARVQRVLYSTLIENAREDTRNAVPHSDRRYTFVVDYGQNMEIPGMLDNVANPNE